MVLEQWIGEKQRIKATRRERDEKTIREVTMAIFILVILHTLQCYVYNEEERKDPRLKSSMISSRNTIRGDINSRRKCLVVLLFIL